MVLARHAIKPLGQPIEVAQAILLLASDEAPFITGANSSRRWRVHPPSKVVLSEFEF